MVTAFVSIASAALGMSRVGDPPDRLSSWLRQATTVVAWLGVIWLLVFWRLGHASFWDPGDEAQYAQASREMLRSGDWLAPTYNGRLFADKPILFYLLQILSYRVFGINEFAARLVPACSAVVLLSGVGWFGGHIFGRATGHLAAVMLAVLPATFVLSSYGILDMTFTALLFLGLAALFMAARGRLRLQWPGFVCLALAVLTKGPLAIVLGVLIVALALVLAPEIRGRLARLHWGVGAMMIVALATPWFVYMWWRFGSAFIEGYALRENIWLYTRGLGGSGSRGSRGPELSYARVLVVGLLPWTPVLIGRLVDWIGGRRPTVEERVLWAWVVAVSGFFWFSHFKLDHYLYPVAPVLCLLAASAWQEARAAKSVKSHLGTALGVLGTGVIVGLSGLALLPMARRLPLSLGITIDIAAVVLCVSGLYLAVTVVRRGLRPPRVPAGIVAAMVVVYTLALVRVIPELERAKPIKRLARWVAASTAPDTMVGAYQMDRWRTSWRFYVDRPVQELDGREAILAFFSNDPSRYCVMSRTDYEDLRNNGLELHIVRERAGLSATSGRALTHNGARNRKSFVVVSGVERQNQTDRW